MTVSSGVAQRESPQSPRRVEINFGVHCNGRCIFCMSSFGRDRKEPWASFKKVQEELRHFYGQGCRAAGFLGGEPTVYPHLLESLAYAKGLGYTQLSICTNGIRLADPVFCRALVQAGLNRVTMSVHSHKAEVEDGLIMRIPGALARKVAAVKNLVALRQEGYLRDNVSLNPVLCRPNLFFMEDFIDFFSGLGVGDIRFNYIWPHGEVKNDRDWIPAFREAMPEIVRIMLVNEKKLHKHLSFGGVPQCALRLVPCSQQLQEYLTAKYLDETSFEQNNYVSLAAQGDPTKDRFVWQEVRREVFKTKPVQCARCGHQGRCDGVWSSYAQLYGLEELQPF